MSLFIDLGIVLFLILSVFIGYKKGLIKVLFSIVSFAIAIVLTIMLSGPISNYVINNTDIDEKIESVITKNTNTTETQSIEVALDKDTMENLPETISKYIATNLVENTVQSLAKKIATTIVNIVVAIGIYIVVRMVLWILRSILEVIAKLPLIKQFNEIGGLVCGFIKGILIVYIVFAIISLVAPLINQIEFILAINKSILGSFVYNNNLILQILFK